MTGEQKKQIRFELDWIFGRPDGYKREAFDEKVDEFIARLEKIWPVQLPPHLTAEQTEAIERWKDMKYDLLSADPLGAERERRTFRSGIGAPPDFGRSSA